MLWWKGDWFLGSASQVYRAQWKHQLFLRSIAQMYAELFSYHISAICVAYLVSTLQALNLTVRSELYVNDCIITDKSFQYVTLPTLSLWAAWNYMVAQFYYSPSMSLPSWVSLYKVASHGQYTSTLPRYHHVNAWPASNKIWHSTILWTTGTKLLITSKLANLVHSHKYYM